MASSKEYGVGIINNYTAKPKNLTQYTAYRGVTDFTQIGQFDQYETGYSFLSVIKMPKFIEVLGTKNEDVKTMANSFKHTIEYEFRGLSGLPDISGQTGTITDGINEMAYINRVTMDTSVQVSMSYFEKSGSLIEKFTEYYLTGIKDRMSQAKTYHGLIKNNDLDPGLENEVFTLLYYVTDNTYLTLERAVLLANAQLTTAETSMYDSSRDNINNHEVTIQFNAFPIMGSQVDKAAKVLLEDITGVHTGYNVNNKNNLDYSVDDGVARPAALDSNDYRYGIMKVPGAPEDEKDTTHSPNGIQELATAVDTPVNADTGFVSGSR